MILSLDRLTDPEIQRAITRAQAITPAVSITERGDGFVRGSVACNGTCGARQYHDGKHDVVLRWDGILTCSCPTVHSICYHAAALLAHEQGVFPDKPRDCASYGCGGQLMYWNGGNGHAAQCPLVDDPEALYERPQSEPAQAIAAGAQRDPAPIAGGRQRTIDKTRPVLTITKSAVWVVRGCGHKILAEPKDAPNTFILPLSPFEGCPTCNDSTLPPAPDQVLARQEAQ